MKRLRVLAEARQELTDALRWHTRQAPGFAERSVFTGSSPDAAFFQESDDWREPDQVASISVAE
jgi:hypothetical protein